MNIQDYYKEHGIMTQITNNKSMITNPPQSIKEIVITVQNLLLHSYWAKQYGVELNPAREKEPWIRSVNDKLIHLSKQGYKHITDQQPPQSKMIAICRDFTILAVALCREVDIPARARCGFATYLEEGKYVDHWVLEYWNAEAEQWTYVDTQLDAYQQKVLNIRFNTLDIPQGKFLTGAEAWQLCRDGKLDPCLFGISKWWGYDYIKCNLLLEANALLKVPMHPWDGWNGYKNLPVADWSHRDFLLMDRLSALIQDVNVDHKSLYEFVCKNDTIKVPEDLSTVINYLE